ncbi:NADH-quinone oxidoreductase subunit L [Paenibacillus larvae]
MVSEYSHYAWLIPLLPLLSFLLLILLGRKLKAAGVILAILMMAASWILSLLVFIERYSNQTAAYIWDHWSWLRVGDYTLRMGFEVNNLNSLMLIVVTTVSMLVYVYSRGYMAEDGRIHVFYAYLSLFSFAMLGLVISVNLVELYIFWELVGAASFLLIGFWYHKPEARAAAKKAFIITRIGDVGLLIGILLLFWVMPGHVLDFASIQSVLSQGTGGIGEQVLFWIAFLIFIGAVGKSGQFPLHTWLPDAMEGPTPVSALIHAATMVAAGVYLVARTYDIFLAAPDALTIVAYVGGFTALFAATIGTAQNDIKRVLAYSTVSQLGYMMMALGLGVSISAGMFHLFTHAFFKALLFLGAGSVIHAVHTQNIQEMGGLSRKMKVTTWTFAVGALALSGIPPFSGFWSKDIILSETLGKSPLLFVIGLLAAFFTAFYMARLFFLVFTGQSRSQTSVKESPAVMTVPLAVLAVLTVVGGLAIVPFVSSSWLSGQGADGHTNYLVMVLSVLAGLLGIGLGYLMYGKQSGRPAAVAKTTPWLYQLVSRKYYLDELYHVVFVIPLKAAGTVLNAVDRYVVDGAVRLVAGVAVGLGKTGSRLQNGQVQTYGLVTLFGLLILVIAMVGRRFLHVG